MAEKVQLRLFVPTSAALPMLLRSTELGSAACLILVATFRTISVSTAELQLNLPPSQEVNHSTCAQAMIEEQSQS